MIIYIPTHSGDRTNIMSYFPLWDQETLIKDIKKGKTYSAYRYGRIGGYVKLLKEMSLEEFDCEFDPSIFTPEEITKYFKKEISEKYGVHLIQKKTKYLSKSQLEIGGTYLMFDGTPNIYLGKVTKTKTKCNGRRGQNTTTIEEGLGFISLYKSNVGKPQNEINFYDCDVLKNPRKFVSKADCGHYTLQKNYYYYNDGISKGSWRYDDFCSWRFLEVNLELDLDSKN